MLGGGNLLVLSHLIFVYICVGGTHYDVRRGLI